MTHTLDATTDPDFVAVDGGGTRCRLALCGAGKHISVEVGSANISTNFNAASLEIIKGLHQLAEAAGHPLEKLSALPAYLGLAGMTGAEIAARLAEVLPFKRLRIEDDRPAALRGALGEQDGMIAHCGTGSFIASQVTDQMRFVGGWGPVLGDPASAQWMGRRALTRSLDVVDGLVPASALSTFLLNHLGGAPGIVAFASRATPAEFGQIAQYVTRHAHDGDALGQSLMQDATDKIVFILNRLGWVDGNALCLTGGIAPHYASYLPANMRACLRPPAGAPLDGAMSLGRAFSQEISTGEQS